MTCIQNPPEVILSRQLKYCFEEKFILPSEHMCNYPERIQTGFSLLYPILSFSEMSGVSLEEIQIFILLLEKK